MEIKVTIGVTEELAALMTNLTTALGQAGKGRIQINEAEARATKTEEEPAVDFKRHVDKKTTKTEAEADEPELTAVEMQKRLATLKRDKKLEPDAIKKVIQKFGKEKISDTDPKHFAEILKLVESLS